MLTELQNRGVQDIFIACVDGLKGFPEAIEAVYPQTDVQLCIVHMVRAALNYVSWKDRKEVAADLRLIYGAATAAEAEGHRRRWKPNGNSIPALARCGGATGRASRRCSTTRRKSAKPIYTTNAVESLNRSLRKIIKTRGAFPNEESAIKLLYLALRLASKKWTMPIHHWKEALNYFLVLWPDRVRAPE